MRLCLAVVGVLAIAIGVDSLWWALFGGPMRF